MNLTDKFIRAIGKFKKFSTLNGGFYKVCSSKFTILHLGQKLYLRLNLMVDVLGNVEQKVTVYETASFNCGKIINLDEFINLYGLCADKVNNVVGQIIPELIHTQEEILQYRNLELEVMRQLSEAGLKCF